MKTVVHLTDLDFAGKAFKNLSNLLADETIEMDHATIVANGSGVKALTAGTEFEDQIRTLLDENDTVTLRACSNSLRAQDIPTSDVIRGVDVVSSGIAEVTRLQADGFAYVKP